MANVFLKPTVIVRAFLGLLQRELVLPNLVWSDPRLNQVGYAAGDTVTLQVPARLAARDYEFRTRTNPIVVDELAETSVPLTLNRHPYSAVAITDEQLTLDIIDFSQQVLAPQVRGVAEKMESYIAAEMSGATYAADHTIAYKEATDDPYKIAVAARKVLNKAEVPMADRVLLLGSDVEAAFLNSDRISKAQNSGDAVASSALRDAAIGRIAGFDTYISTGIDPGAAYAFHKTAFLWANVAPKVPDGATFGETQTFQNLAMRWLKDYDPNYLRDRSVVSSFVGTGHVTDAAETDSSANGPRTFQRAVKIAFTPAS